MIKKVLRKLFKNAWQIKYTDSLQLAYCSSTVTGNSLKDKTVCISGATGGIGDALIRRFLIENCRLVLIGRSKEKLEDLLNKYKAYDIQYIVLDLTKEDDIKSVFCDFFKKNSIDILINNAGIFWGAREKKFRGMDEEMLDMTLLTNLKSAELLSLISIENRKKDKPLRIINISSICAKFNSFSYSPYGISKAGLLGLTTDINNRFGKIGVSSRSILPGSVATKMANLKLGDNVVGNNNVLNRPAFPEEIAAIAAFLSSKTGSYCINDIVASANEKL